MHLNLSKILTICSESPNAASTLIPTLNFWGLVAGGGRGTLPRHIVQCSFHLDSNLALGGGAVHSTMLPQPWYWPWIFRIRDITQFYSDLDSNLEFYATPPRKQGASEKAERKRASLEEGAGSHQKSVVCNFYYHVHTHTMLPLHKHRCCQGNCAKRYMYDIF